MKSKLIVAGLFFSLALMGCKKEEAKKESAEPAKEVQTNTVDITSDIVLKKDDMLIVYYRDGSNEWFDDDHAIWLGLKGSNDVQTAKFSLPEGVLPIDLRFDFSSKEGQEPVEIRNIKVSYLGKSFEVPQDKITKYFVLNEGVKHEEGTAIYTPVKNAKGIYDPFLSMNMEFYNELHKVTGGGM